MHDARIAGQRYIVLSADVREVGRFTHSQSRQCNGEHAARDNVHFLALFTRIRWNCKARAEIVKDH